MNGLIISNEQEEENAALLDLSKNSIARISVEKWNIEERVSVAKLKKLMKQRSDMDVVYMDVTREDAIAATEEFRKEHKEAVLLVIADEQISPMEYLKPSVQATSLLLRPFDEEQARQVIFQTWDWYAEKLEDDDAVLVVRVDHETIRIPLNKIMYIESTNKKVNINLEQQTYILDDTLEHLEKKLPEYFLRTHRSFLVNRRKVREVYISKGIVCLEQDIEIPLSRSYKQQWKELKKNLEV